MSSQKKKLTATFDAKVRWYVVTVKLDLEARGIIERVPKSSPHILGYVHRVEGVHRVFLIEFYLFYYMCGADRTVDYIRN